MSPCFPSCSYLNCHHHYPLCISTHQKSFKTQVSLCHSSVQRPTGAVHITQSKSYISQCPIRLFIICFHLLCDCLSYSISLYSVHSIFSSLLFIFSFVSQKLPKCFHLKVFALDFPSVSPSGILFGQLLHFFQIFAYIPPSQRYF